MKRLEKQPLQSYPGDSIGINWGKEYSNKFFEHHKKAAKASKNSHSRAKNSKRWILVKRMYQYLYQFAEVTTFHGCKHFAARGRHCAEYLLWTITLLAAIGMTIYIDGKAWHRFQNSPTVIVMERNYRRWNITFPTATFCPREQVDREELEKQANAYQVSNKTAFVDFFTALASSEYETYAFLPDYDEVPPTEWLKIIVNAAVNMSYTISSTLVHEHENLETVLTDVGICYSYNSKIAPFFNPRALIGLIPRAERSQSLLFCNVLDGEAFARASDISSVFNLTITGPYEVPYIGTPYRECDENGTYEFDTSCVPIISTPEVNALSVQQRKCRTRADGSLKVSSIYSYNICRMECTIGYAIKLCGCIPYIYFNKDASIRKDNVTLCDVKGLKCLGRNGTLLAELKDPFTNKRMPCNCYPLCTDYHFRLRNEHYNKWGSKLVQWQITDYPQLRYKRTIIFSFADLLVNIGGAAGLFLGCSVLSFVELIYYVTLRLALILLRRDENHEKKKTTGVSMIMKRRSPFEFVN